MTKKQIDIQYAHELDEQHLSLLMKVHTLLSLGFRKFHLQNQDQLLNNHM